MGGSSCGEGLAGAFVGGFVSAIVIFVIIILILYRIGLMKDDTSVCKDKISKKAETGRQPSGDMVDQHCNVIQDKNKENKHSSTHVENQTAHERPTAHKNTSTPTGEYESLATPGLYENTKVKGQNAEAANTYEELKTI